MTLTPNALCIIDNKIYFSDRYVHGLFVYDIKDKKTSLVSVFEKEMGELDALHYCVVEKDNKLYFLPFNAENIAIYNIDNKTLEYVSLPAQYENTRGKFFTGAIVNEKIYMFGYDVSGVLVYNIKSQSFKCIYQPLVEKSEELKKRDLWEISKVINVNDVLYAVSPLLNILVKIDTSNDDCEVILTGKDAGGYSDLVQEGNHLLLVPYQDQSLKKYDIEKNELVTLDFELKANQQFYFCSFCLSEKKHILVPYDNISNAMLYDFENDSLQDYQLDDVIVGKGITSCFNLYDEVIINDIYESCLYFLDKKRNKAYKIDLTCSVPIKNLSNKRLLRERYLFGIKELIECLNGE